ncbi:putative disease resistance protein At4g19050 isoform X1 [Salvia splendens]|nr:putative disease resistance protein At4g19050 isoform X1 [Salvia splendens]XP_042030663.1 putative disease resistance protein At4g19050 isoform X1 [Salvia splendens]XP_042030664.1 putative disease resistance protein At4g19050 isoform X1 [Salvia splendens]XP_042030665.1 putative disease resistance protein At4g19050 isoform X1 [Salvia splendens]
MRELRFLDLSDTKIRILPSSLFKLSKLKVLLFRNCICIEKLPPEIGDLKKMEVLDLSGTELYDLPAEISQLDHMKRMHLSFYGPDDESEYELLPCQLVSPSFLSEMEGITSLSISVHPEDHRWTEAVACIVNDISKLEMLSSLYFYFPEIEMFENFIETSSSWNNQSLSKFDFAVGQDVKRIVSRVPDDVESLFSQHERCLRYVNADKTSSLIKSVITRATAFYLDHHTDIRSLSEFDISSFRSMKFCIVRECPKMQAILDEKNARGAFPCLEYLGIYFIWELRQIWKPLSQASRLNRIFKAKNFEALKYLMIKTCPKLRFIFWESMLLCLASLEELVVEDCEGVEKTHTCLPTGAG